MMKLFMLFLFVEDEKKDLRYMIRKLKEKFDEHVKVRIFNNRKLRNIEPNLEGQQNKRCGEDFW